MRTSALVAFALVACQRGTPADVQVAHVERQEIASGVEFVSADVLFPERAAGTLRAIYADPAQVDLDLVINTDHANLNELAKNALVVVNAGFFTADWRPTGLLVSGGKKLSPFIKSGGAAGSGVFIVGQNALTLLDRATASAADFEGANLALQAGPRLIEPDGRPGIRSDDGRRGDRTVIGIDRRGRLVLALVRGPAGWSSGPTLFELQRVLGAEGLGRTKHAELAFQAALNLDGGPSSGMHVRDPGVHVDSPPASAVYSAIALTPKK